MLKLIAERAAQLRLGCALTRPTDGIIPTVDCGAMLSNDRFDELRTLIDSAVNHGAILEHGGQPWRHPYLENGYFFSPTVLGNVDPASEIAQRECKPYLYILIVVYADCATFSVRSYCACHEV